MAQFTKDTARIDPYKNFKFVVSWDGQPVAGVSSVSGLSRSTEPIEHREGADPITTRVTPGRTRMAPVTLQRGVTHDQAFEWWANSVWFWSNAQTSLATNTNGQNMSLSGTPSTQTDIFRKDIYLALYNEAGQKVIGYNLYRCWPSEFEALGDLDANGNGIVFQRLVLQLEGWERDTSVSEPTPAVYADAPAAS
ncbi:MAG TPA: phage tail protein [Longimicrobiaceae bacterium]|nr:phage tail protein [Longimicrobiaceae bacterium]